MRYRYLDDFRRGISVFAIFSYGIAVLGTPQCPPPKRTSSTTYSNTCLWLGTRNNFVSNNHALLSWSSYTKSFTRNLDFSPYMFGLCRRTFSEKSFQRKWGPQTTEIL